VSKPTVPEVLPLVRAYCAKPGNWNGGSLHIVLADDNVSDSDVQHCIEWARERGDDDGAALGEILLRMSKTQRLRLASRYLDSDDPCPQGQGDKCCGGDCLA
jgi:hypothetical protein